MKKKSTMLTVHIRPAIKNVSRAEIADVFSEKGQFLSVSFRDFKNVTRIMARAEGVPFKSVKQKYVQIILEKLAALFPADCEVSWKMKAYVENTIVQTLPATKINITLHPAIKISKKHIDKTNWLYFALNEMRPLKNAHLWDGMHPCDSHRVLSQSKDYTRLQIVLARCKPQQITHEKMKEAIAKELPKSKFTYHLHPVMVTYERFRGEPVA